MPDPTAGAEKISAQAYNPKTEHNKAFV